MRENSTRQSKKRPPYDEDAEKCVIGSILLEDYTALDIAIERGITEDSFYFPANRIIYGAMLELGSTGSGFDIILLKKLLEKKEKIQEIGGIQYMEKCIDITPTAAHIGHYVRIMQVKEKLRAVITMAREVEAEAFLTDDPKELLAQTEGKILAIGDIREKNKTKTQICENIVERLQHSIEFEFSGVQSAFHAINQKVMGYEGLVVLAARPSQGKSTLMLNEIDCEATQGDRPGFISLEMSAEQCLSRMACAKAEITMPSLKQGKLSVEKQRAFMAELERLKSLDFFINDESHTIDSLCSCARRMKMRDNISILWIDYLQIISGIDKYNTKEAAVSDFTSKLVKLRKQLGIPIAVLSQLSRALEGGAKMAPRRPRLSDLRDSGAIEQDGDIILLMSRCVDDEFGTLIEVAKNRDGPTADVILERDFKYMRFKDYTQTDLEDIPNEEQRELLS